MWATIVNTLAVIGGALLGTLIKRGFTRGIIVAGVCTIAGLASIGAAVTAFYDTAWSIRLIIIGLAATGIWVLLGLLLKGGLPKPYSEIIMQGIGLSVVIIGIDSAFKTQNMVLVILCLVLGGIAGQFLRIEERLDNLGKLAQKRFGGGENSTFSQGFVNASLIFCVGAMAIVGALDAGLKGSYVTLYAKSMLDGITSIVLATTLGIGVAFSALAVLLYQGLITLASGALYPYLSDMVVNEMTAVGGILILGIGLSMLNIKKFHIGNFLPAIFIPMIYFPLLDALKTLLEYLGW